MTIAKPGHPHAVLFYCPFVARVYDIHVLGVQLVGYRWDAAMSAASGQFSILHLASGMFVLVEALKPQWAYWGQYTTAFVEACFIQDSQGHKRCCSFFFYLNGIYMWKQIKRVVWVCVCVSWDESPIPLLWQLLCSASLMSCGRKRSKTWFLFFLKLRLTAAPLSQLDSVELLRRLKTENLKHMTQIHGPSQQMVTVWPAFIGCCSPPPELSTFVGRDKQTDMKIVSLCPGIYRLVQLIKRGYWLSFFNDN